MKGTILVVDDNEDSAELLRDLLRKRGFDATAVSSGPRCLEQLRTHPADVVVTDVHMPGMSGIELAQALRARGIGVPLIMMTADPSEVLEARADAVGARCPAASTYNTFAIFSFSSMRAPHAATSARKRSSRGASITPSPSGAAAGDRSSAAR